MDEYKIYFAKTRENGIIPKKRLEDAGYDLYACFDESYIKIERGEIVKINTGIATAFSSHYAMIIKERGSTGSLGLSVRMGVIDSGFRGEIKVGINNTGQRDIIITKDIERIKKALIRKRQNKMKDRYNLHCNELDIRKLIEEIYFFYPYEKAIAQAVMVKIPKLKTRVIPYEKLLKIPSERGVGMLGSTGK